MRKGVEREGGRGYGRVWKSGGRGWREGEERKHRARVDRDTVKIKAKHCNCTCTFI